MYLLCQLWALLLTHAQLVRDRHDYLMIVADFDCAVVCLCTDLQVRARLSGHMPWYVASCRLIVVSWMSAEC